MMVTIFSCINALAGPLVTLIYPLYASAEAIESKSKEQNEQWLAYWIVYAILTLFEMIASPILAWIPLWHTAKLILMAWMVLPHFKGATFVYNDIVREQLRQYGYLKAPGTATNANANANANASKTKFFGIPRPKKS